MTSLVGLSMLRPLLGSNLSNTIMAGHTAIHIILAARQVVVREHTPRFIIRTISTA